MLLQILEIGKTYSLLVGKQIRTTSVETGVQVSQKERKKPTTWFNYTPLSYKPELCNLLSRYELINVHLYSPLNRKKGPDVPQMKNWWEKVVYFHTRILLSFEKNENLNFRDKCIHRAGNNHFE